ncbi:dynein regulatory complex protein 9 [Notolabrus celidotus]|uniref:dynein regulatory complex protein 9 n=1 Tax=Notolabrus celidotus TaxID=1203425 RepID=UPI0014907770|nr:dynein regulatory complex protein 9 [Notolabrus celidotus]XP_034547026.1 dynein regulatory complex protein 9 [Notolabrus celidotus]
MLRKGVKVLSTKTQSEDAPESHDVLPGKKSHSPEAQRILNILENCISQIEFAATLPCILKLGSVSSDVDKGLSRALQEHQTLSERLETLEGLKNKSNGEQEGIDGKESAQLEEDFQNSFRNLLRLVRVHPEAISYLRAEQKMEAGESESILIKELKKFHSHAKDKLLTSVDEELQQVLCKSSSSNHLDNIDSQEGKLDADLKKVNEQISEKNIQIENLQSLLGEKNTEEAGLTIPDSHQTRATGSKMSRFQKEIDQVKSQLNNEMFEQRKAEREIQEKSEELETEIEHLLQTFDNDAGEIQARLELNEINYKKELEELRELEMPFSVLEVEFNQIQEKKYYLEEVKMKEEMRELELKTKAAIYAQAWWRGYCVRRTLKNKGKNKKAKKGKGKKTK